MRGFVVEPDDISSFDKSIVLKRNGSSPSEPHGVSHVEKRRPQALGAKEPCA
jgi:hypothetical protein